MDRVRLLRRVLVGSAFLVLASAEAAPPIAMPHPAPIARRRPANNGACEGCHDAIAAEWRASLHHNAFTDADYQRAIQSDPDPFCRGCHAPEKDAALGVACVTCHVPSSEILASAGSRLAPHAVLRSSDFGTEAACARCHEFNFPDEHLRRAPLAMQRTITEHRGRDDTCASCHMHKTNGHADHRFAASRDEAFVRSAVVVSARRVGPMRVEVRIAPAAIGHAFPTGDLFRRVRVTVGAKTRYLARHYASRQERPGVIVRSEVGDDRVVDRESLLTFDTPPATTRVSVVYERAEGPSDVASSNASVAGAISLLEEHL